MRVFSRHSGSRQFTIPPKFAWFLSSSAMLFSFQQTINAQDTYVGPSILPPAPNAIDGGNPFQGLGRSDDPGPSREKQFGFPTYNTSSFNANGMQDAPPPVINSDGYANYRSIDSTNSGTGGPGIGGYAIGGSGGGVYGSGGYASSGYGSGYGSSGYRSGYGSSSGASGQSGTGASNGFPGGFIPTSMLDSPPIVQQSNIQAPAPPFKEQINAVQNLPSGFAGQAGFGNVLPSDSQNANGNSIRNINMESNFVNNVNTAAPTQTPISPDSQQGGATSSVSNFATAWPQQNALSSAPQNPLSARSDQPDTGSKKAFSDSTASIFDKHVVPGAPDFGASGASGQTGPAGSGTGAGSDGSGAGVRSSSSSTKPGVSGSANWDKSARDKASEDNGNPSNSKLVPPPPATPSPLSINGVSGGKASSPLEKAVEQIKLGRLPDALTTIDEVLRADSANANAHYLKAVVSVLSRRFTDAQAEYLATLKYSHNAELNNRARVGLTKLNR